MKSSLRRASASVLTVSALATAALAASAATASAVGSCSAWESLKPGLTTRVCIDGQGTAAKKATVEVKNTTGAPQFLRQMYVQAFPLTTTFYCDNNWVNPNATATCTTGWAGDLNLNTGDLGRGGVEWWDEATGTYRFGPYQSTEWIF
ncbi:hypothetical protein [Streptomyces sp. NPDC057675]|uniref:hypothetical protein n=1 Tax=Streptomyces sp. NPDC057675 TaxID=3346204 RepID=UPI003681D06C